MFLTHLFQEGEQNVSGFTSYIEPGDGRRIYINGRGQPVDVSASNNLVNPVNPVNPTEFTPPPWPWEVKC